MKKTISIFLALICATLPFFAEALSSNEAAALLKKVDENSAFRGVDFTADYTLVQEKPGQGKSITTAIMYRRDSKNMYTIRITGPAADKGKGYVQYDETIWFFDPHDRQFTYTTAKNKFQDTNLNNSDLGPQDYSKKYKIESAQSVKLGNFDCVLFTLKASKKNVDYPTIKLWASRNDGLMRKREDYSLSGQLLRTTAVPSYQKVEGKNVPVGMLVLDNLRGQKIDGKMQYEKTQVTIANVSFQKQGDVVYSKQFLENMSSQ